MNKTKITSRQLISLTAGVTAGGSVLVSGALIASVAKQDAWIGSLLTILFGIPVIWIFLFLGKRFPRMNLVEVSRELLGKWFGTIVAGSFLFLFLQISYHIPWYMSDFMTSRIIPETPYYVIKALYITAMSIAILYGLEAFARASEIFIMVASVLFVFVMVMVVPNAKIGNLQPVLENGLIPVLKSSAFLSCFLTFPPVVMLMIYPAHLDDPKEGGKFFFKGYFLGGGITCISILMSVLALGWAITANSRFPVFRLANLINVGIVFSRIEIIVFVIWVLTQFIFSTVFFYGFVTGLSQLLKLKDHKRLVLPLALLLLTMSEVVFPDVAYQENWIVFAWVPYIFTHGFILPVFLLVVYWVKKRVLKMDIGDNQGQK